MIKNEGLKEALDRASSFANSEEYAHAYYYFKKLIELTEEAVLLIKDEAIREVKELQYLGIEDKTMVIGEVGGRYKYEKTNCEELFGLEKRVEDLKKELKYLKGPRDVLDEETGEVVTIYPAYKMGGGETIIIKKTKNDKDEKE
jgi:predicted ATPase